MDRSTTHTARQAATKIVRVLHDAGHVAYFAGGCVRDDLLGFEPQDFDVATDARPERVRELFHNSRFVGEAFGVVLVRLMGHEVEVATFRTEWGYEDGRRPTRVEFTDAEHDARRRDFTVNGLFENPLTDDPDKRVIDFVGGKADLQNRAIRAIGDADERFGEDYLRLLRAVRFAARLGFTIEERTAAAIRLHAAKLTEISRERIGQEVRAMLTHPTRAASARLIQDLELDGPTLTEKNTKAETTVLGGMAAEVSYPAALAAWCIDRYLLHGQALPIEQPAKQIDFFVGENTEPITRRWRKGLCLSNDQRDSLRALFQCLPRAMVWPTTRIAGRKRLLASSGWGDAESVLRAAAPILGINELMEIIGKESLPLLAEGVAPPPLVTGDDLVAMGKKPGPSFRRLLEEAYDAQLEGMLHDRDGAMAWLRSQA